MTIKKSNAEKFAFVVMPFEDVFNDIYFNNIEKCLSSENYLVKRADSFLHQRNILKDIVQNIDRADLIIADVTRLNPNVIYELGIAHSLLNKFNIPKVVQQIKYLRWKRKNDPKSIKNPAGFLIKSIEKDFAPPPGYEEEDSSYNMGDVK